MIEPSMGCDSYGGEVKCVCHRICHVAEPEKAFSLALPM